MRKDTAICATLVTAFILGFVILIFSLPWLDAMGRQLSTPMPSASVSPPARPSGQAIALTCARMANVDMTPGVLITPEQFQEMMRCADRMMAILR